MGLKQNGSFKPTIPHIKGHGNVIYHGFEMMRSFQTRLFSQSAELGLPRGPDGTRATQGPELPREAKAPDGARDGCLGPGGDGSRLALTGARSPDGTCGGAMGT